MNHEKTIFDVLYKNRVFLDYKNIGLKNPQNSNFSKGVSPWFWSKVEIFFNLLFYAKYTEKKYLMMFSLENKRL